MKYFKTYKLFEESKPGAFDDNSWSLKQGKFGPLFLSIINNLSFSNKKNQVKKFINQLDELLMNNYKDYERNLRNKLKEEAPEPIEDDKKSYDDFINRKEEVEVDADAETNNKKDDQQQTTNDMNVEEPSSDNEKQDTSTEKEQVDNAVKLKKDDFDYTNLEINKLINKSRDEFSVKGIKTLMKKVIQLQKKTEERLEGVRSDYINFETGEVYSNMDEVDNVINNKESFLKKRLEKIEDLKDYLNDKISTLKKSNTGFRVKKTNESIFSIDVKNDTWTNKDKQRVTDNLNKSNVKEIFNNKKNFIEKQNKREVKEKLNKYFDEKIKELYSKWSNIYNVEFIEKVENSAVSSSQKNINSKRANKSANKVSSENISDAKVGNFQLMTILKTQFLQDKGDFYKSPFFQGIEKSVDNFFLFNIGGNNVFLIKKIFFKHSIYTFKLIGKISHNDSNLVLDKSYNKVDTFRLESDSIPLYTIPDEDEYDLPLIFFEQNNMYSLNNFGKVTKPLDLISFNIVSLNKNFVRDFIINEIDIDLFKISTELDEDIKKIILDK